MHMAELDGSGGRREQNSDVSGTGGGGYPAAGIGGGGAGGGGANHVCGAGGYTAGINELITAPSSFHINGRSNLPSSTWYTNGGSYFESGSIGPGHSSSVRFSSEEYSFTQTSGNIGGQGGGDFQYVDGETGNGSYGLTMCYIGSGGAAGRGGTIKANSNVIIYAYNGNECTLNQKNADGSTNEDYYYKPLDIYIQNGNPLDVYIYNGAVFNLRYDYVCSVLKLTKNTEWYAATNKNDYTEYVITKAMRGISYIATSYGQGIGSGAGYIEVSNGTYTLCNQVNGELVPIS